MTSNEHILRVNLPQLGLQYFFSKSGNLCIKSIKMDG